MFVSPFFYFEFNRADSKRQSHSSGCAPGPVLGWTFYQHLGLSQHQIRGAFVNEGSDEEWNFSHFMLCPRHLPLLFELLFASDGASFDGHLRDQHDFSSLRASVYRTNLSSLQQQTPLNRKRSVFSH